MKQHTVQNIEIIDPTIANNIASGYSLGQTWFNSTTGTTFIHVSDGVWEKKLNKPIILLNLRNQTTNIPVTNLFTATESGLYQFSTRFSVNTTGDKILSAPTALSTYIEDGITKTITLASGFALSNINSNQVGGITFWMDANTSFIYGGTLLTGNTGTFNFIALMQKLVLKICFKKMATNTSNTLLTNLPSATNIDRLGVNDIGIFDGKVYMCKNANLNNARFELLNQNMYNPKTMKNFWDFQSATLPFWLNSNNVGAGSNIVLKNTITVAQQYQYGINQLFTGSVPEDFYKFLGMGKYLFINNEIVAVKGWLEPLKPSNNFVSIYNGL